MQAYGAVDLLQVEASCVVTGIQNGGVNMLLLMICLSVVQLQMKHKICSVLPFELQSIILLIVLKDLNYQLTGVQTSLAQVWPRMAVTYTGVSVTME